MRRLIEEYNKLFPAFASDGVVVRDYTFDEVNNKDKKDTFRRLTVNGMDGIVIPSVMVKEDTSFFQKSGSSDILKEDCDGIFFTEQDGRKCIYLCELKSTFSTQQINKAKNQIIGSYLKLHSLLSLLQSYDANEWTVKGIITSFVPDEEQRAFLLRQKERGDKLGGFCYNLYRDKKYCMSKMACGTFYAPMNVPELTLYYVSVPDRKPEYAVDFKALELGSSIVNR